MRAHPYWRSVATNNVDVLGISVGDWNWFLRIHSDQADPAEVRTLLFHRLKQNGALLTNQKVDRLTPLVQAFIDAWEEDDD